VLLVGVAFNAFLVVLALSTRERASDETASRQETRRRMTGHRLG
jgi:multisubunit Na+/H+ antiporter MnhC subunit